MEGSSFARRHAHRPKRVVDACVILASPVEPSCARCLVGLSFEFHGYITHQLLGEVVHGACENIPEVHLRHQLLVYLAELIALRRLAVLPIVWIPPERLEKVREKLPYVTSDDAVHLAEMQAHGIREFVTIDNELTSRKNGNRMAQLGLKIIDPRSGEL